MLACYPTVISLLDLNGSIPCHPMGPASSERGVGRSAQHAHRVPLQHHTVHPRYGTYLHWGFEVPWLKCDHPIVNTAFQHHLHHAISIKNKPLHTGFMFKIWDQLFGTMYEGKCFCAMCGQKEGKRTIEAWKQVEIHDYSVLLKSKFWLTDELDNQKTTLAGDMHPSKKAM